jgi:hypothetical protein
MPATQMTRRPHANASLQQAIATSSGTLNACSIVARANSKLADRVIGSSASARIRRAVRRSNPSGLRSCMTCSRAVTVFGSSIAADRSHHCSSSGSTCVMIVRMVAKGVEPDFLRVNSIRDRFRLYAQLRFHRITAFQ